MATYTVLLELAYRGGTDPRRLRDLLEANNLSPRYLEPVVQALVKEGILVSHRGPKGGYALAKSRQEVNLGQVARLVAGVDREVDEQESDLFGVVKGIVQEAEVKAMVYLDGLTLQDLCNLAYRSGIHNPWAMGDTPI
ncbi:MAG: hypothetical protein AUJ55_00480 [Proteobacteria bacterium CG1_02_64_396]|nr:MAG: hypothetical protein AUJ55_00480 [Proteobacteria bacterium CG1_02_64_396]